MAALLANIGNTAIADVLIIYKPHPVATIRFQGSSIVIRLCYLHVFIKFRRKLLKDPKYGNPVGKILVTLKSQMFLGLSRDLAPRLQLGFKVKI